MSNLIEKLSQIRKEQGVHALQNSLEALFTQNQDQAIELVNDHSIPFPWLFFSLPVIKKLYLFEELNERNICALKLCAHIQRNFKLQARVFPYSYENKDSYYPILIWMFETGIAEDGFNDDYDEIMDGVVSLLIHNYQETTILPQICELIYDRNRKGTFYHDLIWAYFRSNNHEALAYIAEHFRSKNPKDIRLTCKLLHCDMPETDNPEQYYYMFMNWYDENKPYLSFTDEFFQKTNKPQVFQVDMNAKYLTKPVQGNPEMTENEANHLMEFQNKPIEDQILLSHFAHTLNKQSQEAYNRFMSFPVSQQLDIARNSTREV
ncbi:hypothetical protein RBG61_04135 [Paludicola sp. MB14-C6]|uniref:hypothetical protein n=1 Tax=Paludihabitans sp. MB14-C6 TaxID=3070656 RepID=UPI0027DB1D83|nr:hypothetical protein [Paludicola sp. MB14-C6]WMJ23863.1 hypothetical protein RBG61_04135 [Paludicola sp. MB14-C6]